VLQDGEHILSNVISSQVEIHRPYGGVVPELASRHHVRNIVPVVQQALDGAGLQLQDLDGIAVTQGPGLVGALLVGLQLAKSISYVAGLPFVGVNHLVGHLTAPFLEEPDGRPPHRHVALLASGGHTALVLVEGFGDYRLLGRSRDDAAGEAFDKVAKLLGLGYPGGPVIEMHAQKGDGGAIDLPRALPGKDELDFSFSGLKTAVANHVRRKGKPTGSDLGDLCASFQRAVADVLVRKAGRAVVQSRARALTAGGGVLANGAIREALAAAAGLGGFSLHLSRKELCTDNAAMIAAAGTKLLLSGKRDDLNMNVLPRLSLG
jgi:N6-L-threonylcarbamoyladenine synthase